MKMYISLSVLLISLLAVGAYAQTQGEQVKEQIRPEDPIREIGSDENSQNPGNGTATRTFDGPKDSSGDKALDGDKVGDQPKNEVKEQIKPEDPIREIGSDENSQNPGNGTATRTFDGPKDSSGDKALDGECDGDQTRNQGDGDGVGDGDNHELGDTNRRGGTFADETGPHGPMDHGDKILDGTFAGDMLQHSWGPGEDIGGPFGPNIDHVGYGQGGAVDGEDPTKSTKGAARAGRR